MKKKIFIAILIVGCLSAFYGLYEYNRPLSSLDDEKPAASLNANDLYMAFENDEEKANTNYLDKVVKVSGVIEKLEVKNNKATIYLETEGMMSSIICELERQDDLTNLKVGKNINVKGLCTGYLMDVILVRSVIVQS